MSLSLTIIAALLLDYLFDEVRKFHPLVGFGNIASAIEKRLNNSNYPQKILGAFSWGILVLPLPAILWAVQLSENISILVDILILYFALGANSLKAHVLAVFHALKSDDIELARQKVAMIVSRDTQSLDDKEIARATVETTFENGHDAVIASLFWFVIGGAPLVIIHRFANTLDAMWGYRNKRFNRFGWFAAKADDLLGLPSALISGLAYLFAQSDARNQLWDLAKKSFRQCINYKSLNGGWTIATGAYAINIKLGGTSEYAGKVYRSVLGDGRDIDQQDIKVATQLVDKAVIVFVVFIFVVEMILSLL